MRTITFTILGGFLGTILYGIRILFNYYAKTEDGYDPRFKYKYVSAPLEGAGLALVVLALIRGGVTALGGSIGTGTDAVNEFTVFATGGLVGYGTRDVIGWLGGIIRTAFPTSGDQQTPDASGNQQEPNAPPEDS